jgi:hypothetical protein
MATFQYAKSMHNSNSRHGSFESLLIKVKLCTNRTCGEFFINEKTITNFLTAEKRLQQTLKPISNTNGL